MYGAAVAWGLASRLLLGAVGIAIVLMLLQAVRVPEGVLFGVGLVLAIVVIGYTIARVLAIDAALRGR